MDAYDCWLELKAPTTAAGRLLERHGGRGLAGVAGRPLLPRALDRPQRQPDQQAQRLVRARTVYVRLIPPGAADTVHFRLQVPPDAGDTIRLHAKLNYRKFSWFNTHFSFAGESLPVW